MSQRRSQWPVGPHLGRRAPRAASLQAFLLDADDDLGQQFDVRTRVAVRRTATARVLEAEPGECDLAEWFVAVRHGPGLVILDGLIGVETRVGGRCVMQLIGAGDLLQASDPPSDELLESMTTWRALSPARIALLDGEFAERVRPWPQIAETLLRRASMRISDAGKLRAITSQPHLELRLVLLLWYLAERWGRVGPSGIRVTLPLTHRLLGELVSAERPSISHALARLVDTGLVTGNAGDWHLHGGLEDHIEVLLERAPALERAQNVWPL